MRLHVKRDELTQKLVAEFLANGGRIQKEDPQTTTRTLKRAVSLASRHLGKHNRLGARV
jgi:hypothetical protein